MVNQSQEIPSLYLTLDDADVLAGVSTLQTIAGVALPARRIVVGVIGAAGVTLTRPDSTEVTVSQAQLQALGGTIERQFKAIQSDNSTDIGIDW